MEKKKSLKNRYNNYLDNHQKAKPIFENAWSIIVLFLSAFIFAFGFRAFIAPAQAATDPNIITIATGGMSGISQIFVKTFQLIKGEYLSDDMKNTLQSLFYTLFNIPIIILAWKGIGKRFAIFTLINVLATSIFTKCLPESFVSVFVNADDNMMRVLFGGICVGLSSSLALMVDGSAGGVDVVSYYIAIKKSTSVGKYVLLSNSCIITIFTVLSYFPVNSSDTPHSNAWQLLLYAILYSFVSSMVIDYLSRRNKKSQIQIITKNEDMPKILLANFKHGCTVVDAKGAFSGESKKIIYMVVSSFEVKRAISVIQEADPNAFVNVVSVSAVYGQFHIDPIK